MKLFLKWLLSATALLALSQIDSGVQLTDYWTALLAAFMIGLLNLVIRPILVVLTLPVTLVSLGLFLFVINAMMFWAAAGLLDGFQVRNFSHALLGSFFYSIMGVVIDSALERLFPAKR
jgi:putative membrane protein